MNPIQPVLRAEPVSVHLVDRTWERQSRERQEFHHHEQEEQPVEAELTDEATEAQAKGTHLNIQV